MPNLPSFTSREIARLLEKAGFRLKRTTGSHYIFYKEGLQRPVSVPFHTKTLPKGTQHAIFRQAQLTEKEIKKLLRKRIS